MLLDRWQSLLRVQFGLLAYRYYEGAIDGVVNPSVKTALKRFQGDFELPVTGTVTPGVIDAPRISARRLAPFRSTAVSLCGIELGQGKSLMVGNNNAVARFTVLGSAGFAQLDHPRKHESIYRRQRNIHFGCFSIFHLTRID